MDDPHVLLARALGSLSPEEQGEVLKSLLPTPLTAAPQLSTSHVAASHLATSLSGATPGAWLAQSVASRAAVALQLEDELSRPRAEKVGLLVRLPAQTHRRLKEWSDSHGHSMNVVVRGLVEQFLDAQSAARGPDG
ncbi:MAG: hypothetical protein AVDCRST_MAG07-2842 [uncultured Frankineae bacterium]|uniref:Uncharacterized protein n=1 Tax=uncultured Frankineae bacterium TaxID=437475 RepID=A0A6J4M370_9ACTN|nr:MAG: hypothetical protein AVDCRST_MAG07-2842 [uncultured Frankineae bacterium]